MLLRPMMARRYPYLLVFLAVLCVLSIFFFPVAQGPYPAVHGPVTALQSFQVFTQVVFGIVLSAFALLWFWSDCAPPRGTTAANHV
jgi:hypothetical protein